MAFAFPNMLLYCDDWTNDVPYRPALKIAGTLPLPYGLTVSGSFQSLAGRPLGLTTTAGNRISGPGYGDVRSRWVFRITHAAAEVRHAADALPLAGRRARPLVAPRSRATGFRAAARAPSA